MPTLIRTRQSPSPFMRPLTQRQQHKFIALRRKHFTLMLANKIKRFAAPGKKYLVRVDPIHSSYAKADEAAEVILRNIVEQVPSLHGRDVIHSVRTVDSRETPGVQLSDLLLGAVMAARHGEIESSSKQNVIARIADHLG